MLEPGFYDYVYIRADPDPSGVVSADPRSLKASDLALTRAHLKSARDDGFEPERRFAVLERVGAAVAASGRPKLMKLIRKLDRRSTLIVKTLDCLGRDAEDILKTIRLAAARANAVHCTEISQDELLDCEDFIATLEALAPLDRMRRTEQTRAYATGRGVAGGRIGRPRSLSDEAREAIRSELKAGESVSALARRYNTSRQTILRVRDEEGRTSI